MPVANGVSLSTCGVAAWPRQVGAAEARQEADATEYRIDLHQPRTQRLERVVGQPVPEQLAERADDRPVLTRLAGRIHRGEAPLHAAFGVHIGAGLFGVGGTRQDHVGTLRAGIAVMALIDDEAVLPDPRRIDLVGAQQPQHLHAAVQHLRDGLAIGTRHEAEVQCADARSGSVQHIEAVPLGCQRTDLGRQPPRGRQDGAAIRTAQRRLAEHDHRLLCIAENCGEVMRAIVQGGQHVRRRAQLLRAIGQVGFAANQAYRDIRRQPALTDPSVQHRRFLPRIGADQQDRIGFVDPGDAGVEAVEIAPRHIEPRTILAAIQMLRTQRNQQILQCEHALRVAQIAGDSANAVAGNAPQFLRDGGEGFGPGCGNQLAVASHPGPIQPPALQPVDREAGLVAQPLLVHVVIDARQDAQHFRPARIDADIAADRIEHVDAVHLVQLPRPRDEGVGLRGQRADRAEIDDISGQLGVQRALDIGADFHVLATPGRAEFRHAGDLGDEADAARAMYAARHHSLHQRAEILVLHRALVLGIARMVHAIAHGLILQVALAALIADRTIQRVIDQQEFHHAAPRLAHHRRVSVHHHAVGDRVGAGGNRLGRRLLDLHQTHAAIAGDRQTLVVAEARNFDAGHLAGLDDRGTVGDFDLNTVDGDFGH